MLSNSVRRCNQTTVATRALGASAPRAFGTQDSNPFAQKCLTSVPAGQVYDFNALGDARIQKLPISIRILLESVLRNCDNKAVLERDIETVLDWKNTAPAQTEIPFMPARVILQDFTGVPAVVDLAAMRDAVRRMGFDSELVNPLVPVDLVIDHSIQVDAAKTANALQFNENMEFQRNSERFSFLKWGAQAFDNMRIVPPGSGIVHQVNLEYLAHVVYKNQNGVLYPDSVVGTDSHTTMIDGLGVVGWGVGGIEAEAVMLGQPISMVLPEVIGFELTGELPQGATATDMVLTCTQMLRKRGVVGKFVEFFGPGVAAITVADRATIANMAPEYGATMGFFPVDSKTLDFMRQTGRSEEHVSRVEQVTRKLGIFTEGGKTTAEFNDVLRLDLSTVVPSVAGPKRPQDRVTVADLKKDFQICMDAPNSFKGFGVPAEKKQASAKIVSSRDGKEYTLTHGSTVIAAITSCTNTSNPNVIMAAGMLAKNAHEKGLNVPGYVKTSLSPGSKAVTEYLKAAGLDKSFEAMGFYHAGYGCMTCIGNSGELDKEVQDAIVKEDLVVSAVLSGNRNFEGRVHPNVKAAYLASPPLVVAYAIAGRCDIDFAVEPIGTGSDGKPVFLKDIWPSLDEVSALVEKTLNGDMFTKVYEEIAKGTEMWNNLKAPSGKTYEWDVNSTYVQNPPFFESTTLEVKPVKSIEGAHVLLNLGDSITTDHISPAGDIAKNSPAARFLEEAGLTKADFNTYGSRRGNDKIMVRGTFANIRITNKMLGGKQGPQTIHVPSGQTLPVYDAAALYMESGVPTIILAGQEYGSGSSRDWAAKGPYLQGVKAVIAQSFERIHRTNLIGMGVLPLQFQAGQNADSLGLTGLETFDIDLKGGNIAPGETITVKVSGGKSFDVKARVDTPIETEYFKHGGILQYVLRQMMQKNQQ